MQEEVEQKVIEVENESEARVVQALLKNLRENPQEFLDK
jgi:hypothetical protein